MKTLSITLFAAFLGLSATMAQTPQKFNYQGVARMATGLVIAEQGIGLRLSILSGSINGTAVYVETHATATNTFGLFNVQVGNGSVAIGSMTAIDWSTNTYYLQVELDDEGGSNYALMGTQQLVSVPYALHAKNSASTQALNGYPVATTTPEQGQMLQWNGDQWVPVDLPIQSGTLAVESGITSNDQSIPVVAFSIPIPAGTLVPGKAIRFDVLLENSSGQASGFVEVHFGGVLIGEVSFSVSGPFGCRGIIVSKTLDAQISQIEQYQNTASTPVVASSISVDASEIQQLEILIRVNGTRTITAKALVVELI